MTKSRNTAVRIIRTQSSDQNKTNSKRREKSNTSDIQDQKEKCSPTNLHHSSSRKSINKRSIHIIHPEPYSTTKSTRINTYNNPFRSSYLIQSAKSDNTYKNTNHSRSMISFSASSPCFVTDALDIHADNNGIDTSTMINSFQFKHFNNLSQKSNDVSIALLSNRMNFNNPFIQSKNEDVRRNKKKPVGCFAYSPLCIFLCALATFLLLSAIAATIAKATVSTTSIIVTTTTDTTRTTTSVSITTTTTTTTTTITKPTCNISCLNQTWIDNSLLLAKYKFENNYLDETKQYNGTGINNPAFVTGYVGQAVSFAFNASQMVSSSYIPLGNNSYTVDTWIYPTAIINIPHNSICGSCTAPNTNLCFHTTIRYTNSTYYLYHGFYGDDTNSNTKSIFSNEWIHVAFTFDVTTRLQTVYHNGVLLRSKTVNSPFLGMTGDFQIGHIPMLTSANVNNMFQGYIDELSVSGRVKSSCEILEQATLAARFHFDGSQPLLDYGPNSVSTSGSNYAIVSGRILNAISFTSSSPSYFQAIGFLALGIPNQAFSISLWIKPVSLTGSLVHKSDNSLGSGFCTTYLGFASNGSLIAQVLTNTGYVGISYPNLPLTTFSHIVQTWSSTNGLRLYVDNILIGSRTASTSVANSAWINYVSLGSCLNGCGICNSGEVSPTQFVGAVDDFRIYIRELTANDVCALYAYGFV